MIVSGSGTRRVRNQVTGGTFPMNAGLIDFLAHLRLGAGDDLGTAGCTISTWVDESSRQVAPRRCSHIHEQQLLPGTVAEVPPVSDASNLDSRRP